MKFGYRDGIAKVRYVTYICAPYMTEHLVIFQRVLSGQKPTHAPFCMKGATTHTSLHQIGPNLASS